MPEPLDLTSLACPVPLQRYPHVLMAHGGGGKLMQRLIEEMFGRAFSNPILDRRHDSALLDLSGPLAFTTDSFVVRPLFFPGGDLGSLAVHGTVNDLAMAGAEPLYLSAGFILEEGLPMETLWRLVASMAQAAQAAGVQIVTGDTKVVERGKGDGVYINTAGIGRVLSPTPVGPESVRPGDVILLNGDVGRHGIAIMAVREGLEFESAIESDSASVAGLVGVLLREGIPLHCLRDITRGGLASATNEIAQAGRVGIHLDERSVPVREDVMGACEILGFDPLSVACEGRFLAIVPAEAADVALAVMRADPMGDGATVIGEVTEATSAPVTLTSRIGARRILDMVTGEQLPRIC